MTENEVKLPVSSEAIRYVRWHPRFGYQWDTTYCEPLGDPLGTGWKDVALYATPPAAQVQQEAVGHIVHSADAVSRVELEAAIAQQPKADTTGWSLLDRVEFALRDAGFDCDEAFRIAHLASKPAADALGAVREWGGFIEGRYPYTYAYDLLREMNPLRGDNSRAEMAAFVTEHCAKRGIDKQAFCHQLADIYIRHAQAVDSADEVRDAALEAALGQGKA